MYIVFWETWIEKDLDVGYLPYIQIPEGSILRKAIFSGEEYIHADGGGILGIYFNKELAEEHLKIESAWRNRDKLWIMEVEASEASS
jgi:hypothetical protein